MQYSRLLGGLEAPYSIDLLFYCCLPSR